MKALFLIICFWFFGQSTSVFAQNWRIETVRIDSNEANAGLGLQNEYKNPQDAISAIRKIIPKLQEQGYLSASIDSISIINEQYRIYYFLGQQYFWAKVLLDSIAPAILIGADINPQQYSNRALSPHSLARLSERLLQYCENNGYPFAKVWLSDIEENEGNRIKARLRINKAELRKIDSIIVEGDVKITNPFLHRYLDILKGSLYNEKKLKMISSRLRELPYLQESMPWVMSFRPGDTRLSLFLKEKKSNQLNALLGLMPNNLATQKLLLTADVQIALQNLLGNGESISASYQNLQPKSPRMKADIVAPYLLNSPIGGELHFDYFLNNLQFRKVSFQSGIRYYFNGSDFVKLFYQSVSNRIINIDTASILATKQLPINIDTKSNGLGFEWVSNHTDYRINPHKGWQARLGATALQRKVIPNEAIIGIKDGSGFDFASLYDTLQQRSFQYFLSAELIGFVPLGKSLTIKFAYNGGYIATPRIFQNELFQIGGFKVLRGFDEQSIFANQYHIFTTELRLLLSQNSYAYLFSDNAWVQTKFNDYNREALFNGFGLGTTLETKTGLFSIALAFGRSDFIPLRFRESKILFGYVALF